MQRPLGGGTVAGLGAGGTALGGTSISGLGTAGAVPAAPPPPPSNPYDYSSARFTVEEPGKLRDVNEVY